MFINLSDCYTMHCLPHAGDGLRRILKPVLVVLVLSVPLASCKAPSVSQNASSQSASRKLSSAQQQVQQDMVSAPVSSSSQQGQNSMDSPLAEILKTFVGTHGHEWATYDAIKSVIWRDPSPSLVAGTPAAYATHKREGKLLLAGFSDIDLPDGEVGAEAGSRQGNEGESGVTLLGTAESVESFAVMKFYASEDYVGILNKQFQMKASVKSIAGQCGDDDIDPEARQFLQVQAPSFGTVYVEAYVDAVGGKYSPGSTIFEFYRGEPVERIQEMGCKTR